MSLIAGHPKKVRLVVMSAPLGGVIPSMSDWHWEIVPLTYGRFRVIWTDGKGVKDFW